MIPVSQDDYACNGMDGYGLHRIRLKKFIEWIPTLEIKIYFIYIVYTNYVAVWSNVTMTLVFNKNQISPSELKLTKKERDFYFYLFYWRALKWAQR